MAETLTFEQNNEVTSVDNLSAEEQDSLAVGETMQEAEDNRLAGKYENAQELEKAYIELEKKLGEKSEPTSQEESSDEPEPETKSDKEEKPESTILDELWDEATGEKGEYSKETLAKLDKMSPSELAKMHLEYRQEVTNDPAYSRDLSSEDVKQLKGVVGGDENYSNMLNWAQQNLNETEVNMFDKVMEMGNPLAAFFAVKSLAYRYNDAIGYDGKMVTGTAPKSEDTFQSQQEMVAAMSDKRYDNDPAYRRKIMEKLQRSDINF
tara:strand:+ start:2026 stop:2820 length:795 start_codon:yes stop_codon:yes gene_type:complete